MKLYEDFKTKYYTFDISSEEGSGTILRMIGILSRKSIDWLDWRLRRNVESESQKIMIVIRTEEPDKILNLFRSIPEIREIRYFESNLSSELIFEKEDTFVVSVFWYKVNNFYILEFLKNSITTITKPIQSTNS